VLDKNRMNEVSLVWHPEVSDEELLTAGGWRHAGSFETRVFESAARSRDGYMDFGKDTTSDELRLEAHVKLAHDAENRVIETTFWWQEPQAGLRIFPSVNGTLGQAQSPLNSVVEAQFDTSATAMRAVVSPAWATLQFGTVACRGEVIEFAPTELQWNARQSLADLAVRQLVGKHAMGIVRKKIEDVTLPSRKSEG